MTTTMTDQLDGAIASLAVKAPCQAVSNANLTLSGEQTVNGIAVEDGDRVLVKSQTNAIDNGIYIVSETAWQRAPDFDGNRDIVQGTLIIVFNAVAQGVVYQVTAADPIVIGTTAITIILKDNPTVTFPQTDLEILKGVTPVNTAYVEGDLRRHFIPGATDHTTAFAALGTVGGPCFIPRGSWVDNGDGQTWASSSIYMTGAGQDQTLIALGTNCRVIDTATAVGSCYISGIRTSGGAGFFRSTYAGVNVSSQKVIERVRLEGYTVCGIESNSTDEPYWDIQRSAFKAANSTSTIGIALGTNADKAVIGYNSFETNRVHLKIRKAGISSSIISNFFGQFEAGNGTPRIAIWLVPSTDPLDSGQGCDIMRNKFGNETQAATDLVVAFADEGAGATNGVKFPVLNVASTGYIRGINTSHNKLSLSYQLPYIFTTTPTITNCVLAHYDEHVGSSPSYIVQGLGGISRVADRSGYTNVIGPLLSDSIGINAGTSPTLVSNLLGLGPYIDQTGQMMTDPANALTWHGVSVSRAGYTEVLTTRIGAFTLSGATKVGDVTDATGLGTEAAEFQIAPGQLVFSSIASANFKVGVPMWVEFDLKVGAATPMSRVQFMLQYTASGAIHAQHDLTLQSEWKSYRYLVQVVEATANIVPIFTTLDTGAKNVQIGRCRIYHAREPMATGLATVDKLAMAAAAVTTVAPGAGGGGALPATPIGYVTVNINGTDRKLPYY